MLFRSIQIKSRGFLSRAQVQSDVQRLLEAYRRNGRYRAAVDAKVISLPDNRVNLVYEVDEGDKTAVSRISFSGNHAFSSGRLRDVVKTRETGLLGWLRTHDVPDDRLLAPYLPTLARLAPQLGPVAPDGVSSVMLLGEGLLRLARTVPAPGMVLVVEDLHWADPETLALVEYLGDNTREVPLLVVVTSRLHESPAANELVTALEWRRSAETVDLLPMADEDVATMARACLDAEPSDEVVAWLQRYSAGYPLFVEEMLADLRDAGLLEGPLPVLVPRPFARSVEARLGEVGPAAREVAMAAARSEEHTSELQSH